MNLRMYLEDCIFTRHSLSCSKCSRIDTHYDEDNLLDDAINEGWVYIDDPICPQCAEKL